MDCYIDDTTSNWCNINNTSERLAVLSLSLHLLWEVMLDDTNER